jgi:SAM-dependent methyltransferase
MKVFRNYLITSILLLGILHVYIPIRYHTPYPREIGPQFTPAIRATYISLLDQKQPEIFMLGDSMLETAIDAQLAEQQLDRRLEAISLRGTASAIWYLILKNNLVVAAHKPEYLVIFFRDSMMTVPGYRVTGRYFDLVDEYAAPDETLLIERAYINSMIPLEKFAEAYIPVFGSRWTLRQSVDYYIRYPLGGLLLDCDAPCMDQAMQTVFTQDNFDSIFLSNAINAADDYIYTREALDFDEQIGQSFLPEIIRLCRENGIRLILVRMPISRFKDAGTQPPGLDDYIQKLHAYLTENGVTYLDYDLGAYPVEYFRDPLHLNEQGRQVFTNELTEALKNIIK